MAQQEFPEFEDWFKRAVQHHHAGNLAFAERQYKQILGVKPDHDGALHFLGVIAHQNGRSILAATLISRAICENDQIAIRHCNLGAALQAKGDIVEAGTAYKRAIAQLPDFADIYFNMGNALKAQGKLEEAKAFYDRALMIRPNHAEAHNNLANLLTLQGKLADAAAAFRQALAIKPEFADAHYNFANGWREQHELGKSVASYRTTIALRPNHAEAYQNLGLALQEQGKLDQSIQSFERSRRLNPDLVEAEMNLIFAHLYRPNTKLSDILALARRWNERRAARLQGTASHSPQQTDTSRLPHLGFVSADLRHHAVGYLAIPAIEGLAQLGHPISCYSNNVKIDDLTVRFKQAATNWRPITGQADDKVADLIRADGIDILIDLSGYSASNRLLVFARKPAPIQVAWLGYPATTGLQAMDYILADRHQLPSNAEPYYTEAVARLPHSYVVFEPPAEAPPLTALPARSRRGITFGSFNSLKKVSPDVVGAWSRILSKLPDSLLLVKSPALNCSATRKAFSAHFQFHGIDPERLTFIGATLPKDHMAWMQHADIALDPFPYSGGRTTLESLWMGLPVITLAGETFSSRHSLGYLKTIGLGEFVASSIDHYVTLAVELANDMERLATMRSNLRSLMLNSPLCNVDLFVANLSEALSTVWRRWCSGHPNESFNI